MGIDRRSGVGGGESGDGQVEWGERGWGSAEAVSWNGDRQDVGGGESGDRQDVGGGESGDRQDVGGEESGDRQKERGGRGIEWKSGVGGGSRDRQGWEGNGVEE